MLGKNSTKRKKVFAFVCIVIFVGEVILFMLNAATDYKTYTDSEVVKADVINVSDTKNGILNVKYRYNYDSNKYEESAKYEREARVIKAGDEKKIRIRKNAPEQIIATPIKTAVMHNIAFALCLFAYVAASTENGESPADQKSSVGQRFRF